MTYPRLEIDIDTQQLAFYDKGGRKKDYAVSTAQNGPGQINGTGCTPLGAHIVRARIGAGQPKGAVFVGRRPTGEIFSAELRRKFPQRDWILTRILWLSGLEPGKNRLGTVDTMRRYIYIHGAPDDVTLGRIGSAGCIRMNNNDICELFEQVPVGTRVEIVAGGDLS